MFISIRFIAVLVNHKLFLMFNFHIIVIRVGILSCIRSGHGIRNPFVKYRLQHFVDLCVVLKHVSIYEHSRHRNSMFETEIRCSRPRYLMFKA